MKLKKENICLGLSLQLERDLMIWNNKQYLGRPLLVKAKEDSLIGRHRRWYSQFYSEHSPRLETAKQDSLEWWRPRSKDQVHPSFDSILEVASHSLLCYIPQTFFHPMYCKCFVHIFSLPFKAWCETNLCLEISSVWQRSPWPSYICNLVSFEVLRIYSDFVLLLYLVHRLNNIFTFGFQENSGT